MIEDVLSPREIQIANLIAEGFDYRSIADRLGISYQTVKNHCTDIYKKLGIRGEGIRPSIILTRMVMSEQERE